MVLVTGGAGFIGSHLVDALVAQGNEVRVLDNLCTGRISNIDQRSVEFIHGDIRDETRVREAMDGVNAVFHLAALPSVPRSWQDPLTTLQVNAQATGTVMETAITAGVSIFVYSSSSSVYGEQDVPTKSERLPGRPMSPYGASKLLGEQIVLANAKGNRIRALALRYFNVFGPRQDPNSPYSAVIPRFIKHALDGTPATIYGDGLQTRDFTYIDNVISANLLALSTTTHGIALNVGCGQGRSVLDLVDAISGLNGHSLKTVQAAAREGDIRHSVADIRLAEETMGFKPVVPFQVGLRTTYDAFKTS